MIEVSNLRKYSPREGVVRLEADIKFQGMDSPYPTDTIYFEIDEKISYMLVDDSYDPFVLVPLFVAMFHKQTLHIRGKISKRLYQNVKWYIRQIFCDYSPNLSHVNFIVDGFTNPPETRGKIIGASISCGVDALSTIYDHFVREDDPDYRINALFYFNHDMKNHRMNSAGQTLYQILLPLNQAAAEDIGLPLYSMESNVHIFNGVIVQMRQKFISMSYIALYSCILALGNAISRYYISNGSSYEEKKMFREHYHDNDMAGFCDMYLVPLVSNERTDLIIDGCQYRRVDKLKKIVDWDITKKHLNVCWTNNPDGSNCGVCPKCLRTLFPLEIMGKLDDYAKVFDIEQYMKNSFAYKVHCVQNYGKDPFETQSFDFAKENNFPMPQEVKGFVLNGQVALI